MYFSHFQSCHIHLDIRPTVLNSGLL